MTKQEHRQAITPEEFTDMAEVLFIACGKSGANFDITHPLRPLWLALRKLLQTEITK